VGLLNWRRYWHQLLGQVDFGHIPEPLAEHSPRPRANFPLSLYLSIDGRSMSLPIETNRVTSVALWPNRASEIQFDVSATPNRSSRASYDFHLYVSARRSVLPIGPLTESQATAWKRNQTSLKPIAKFEGVTLPKVDLPDVPHGRCRLSWKPIESAIIPPHTDSFVVEVVDTQTRESMFVGWQPQLRSPSSIVEIKASVDNQLSRADLLGQRWIESQRKAAKSRPLFLTR
jgi:hypothetical protein